MKNLVELIKGEQDFICENLDLASDEQETVPTENDEFSVSDSISASISSGNNALDHIKAQIIHFTLHSDQPSFIEELESDIILGHMSTTMKERQNSLSYGKGFRLNSGTNSRQRGQRKYYH